MPLVVDINKLITKKQRGMMNLFHELCEQCSKITTEKYSTSFSSAIKLLHNDLRRPIFNIYGFVRFADEIVDTFHDFNKQELLSDFKKETYDAIAYNGRLLVNRQRLSEKPIVINLELDENTTTHEIILYAHNLGSIPPNTALIVVTAGDKRYELHSSASLEENAVLIFEYSPK